MSTAVSLQSSPWAQELGDLVRAISGGLLFGLPLLYTEEVWFAGYRSEPLHVLAILGVVFLPILVLNRTAGFRGSREITFAETFADTVEAVAIGLVLSAAMLALLGEITADTSWRIILAKTAYEALPFALGISVANHYLRGGRDRPDDDADPEDDAGAEEGRRDELRGTAVDLGATVAGSLFIGITIAPTNEVARLAARLEPVGLLVVIAASLLFSYGIVFVAGFSGQERRVAQRGVFQHPITETVVCYLVALVSALAMLTLFHQLRGPWEVTLALVIVLGLPAAVGGAAGRLAI